MELRASLGLLHFQLQEVEGGIATVDSFGV